MDEQGSEEIRYVTSRDGTALAYRATGVGSAPEAEAGSGPPVVMVDGALGVGTAPMAASLGVPLRPDFTVVDYDRRGRGRSGDTPPYAVAREVEDLAALIDAVGGRAHLCGFSSGGALALEAADALPHRVVGLALYEPPFVLDADRPPLPDDFAARVREAVAAGRRDEAVTLFLTEALLVPPEAVPSIREPAEPPTVEGADGPVPVPTWREMEEIAHTLAYDAEILDGRVSGRPLPSGSWPHVTAPTLALAGGESEPSAHTAARAVAEAIPGARYRVLEGQGHRPAPRALAPLLRDFFGGPER
ncbi:alpha/beta hydrolase [Streptomyces albiaxialis]|uniref:Alpha/beta hydrolase n=1 Tax=Streptomyces albiaxialis TaxID=329523 RepID=A0ABP5HXB9_9ACTN